MNWSFDILPRNNFMYGFVHILNCDIYIGERVTEMPFCFFMSSKYFDRQQNVAQIYQVGSFFVRLLNACSILIHESKQDFGKITLGELYDQNNRKVFKSEYEAPINFSNIDLLITYETCEDNAEIARLIHLAMQPGFIRNILLIIGHEMSFISMYKALDEIKHFLKGKQSVSKLINKKVLNRFTHTANNFEISGIDARHGTNSEQRPPKPMSLKEAQLLLTTLIRHVFLNYFQINLPTIPDQENRFLLEELFD